MSKDRMSKAAVQQIEKTARDLPEERQEKRKTRKTQRTERLVIRLSKDELHRITRFYDDLHLPISTGARSTLLDHIRKA